MVCCPKRRDGERATVDRRPCGGRGDGGNMTNSAANVVKLLLTEVHIRRDLARVAEPLVDRIKLANA